MYAEIGYESVKIVACNALSCCEVFGATTESNDSTLVTQKSEQVSVKMDSSVTFKDNFKILMSGEIKNLVLGTLMVRGGSLLGCCVFLVISIFILIFLFSMANNVKLYDLFLFRYRFLKWVWRLAIVLSFLLVFGKGGAYVGKVCSFTALIYKKQAIKKVVPNMFCAVALEKSGHVLCEDDTARSIVNAILDSQQMEGVSVRQVAEFAKKATKVNFNEMGLLEGTCPYIHWLINETSMIDFVDDLPSELMNQDVRKVIAVMYLSALEGSECEESIKEHNEFTAIWQSVDKVFNRCNRDALRLLCFDFLQRDLWSIAQVLFFSIWLLFPFAFTYRKAKGAALNCAKLNP